MNCVIIIILVVQSVCTSPVDGVIDGYNTLSNSFLDYFGNGLNKRIEGSVNDLRKSGGADGSLLADLVRNGAIQIRADATKRREVVNVRRDDVYTHLIRNGGIRTDFTKPSIGFMLQVCIIYHDFHNANILPVWYYKIFAEYHT